MSVDNRGAPEPERRAARRKRAVRTNKSVEQHYPEQRTHAKRPRLDLFWVTPTYTCFAL